MPPDRIIFSVLYTTVLACCPLLRSPEQSVGVARTGRKKPNPKLPAQDHELRPKQRNPRCEQRSESTASKGDQMRFTAEGRLAVGCN